MTAPNGNLDILREYTCGCIVYRDEAGQEFHESGMFCQQDEHGRQLVRGIETQIDTMFACTQCGSSMLEGQFTPGCACEPLPAPIEGGLLL